MLRSHEVTFNMVFTGISHNRKEKKRNQILNKMIGLNPNDGWMMAPLLYRFYF